ncbi:MAG: ASKHA domain-containing protein [Candidatus Marinimicrobia bacterium]|nr:ASKHA domain-containing protein [Candidatus Neomarinimicrobiota bacterium]
MKTIKIKIKSENKTLEFNFEKKQLLSDFLNKQDIPISQPCGGAGICGKCKIQFTKNAPNPTTDEKRLFSNEEINSGFRLACQTKINSSCEVIIPPKLENDSIKNIISKYKYTKKKAIVFDTDENFGLAVDIGTTTLSCSIVDINSKDVIDTITTNNPQSIFGFDVISRIDYSSKSEANLEQLQKLIINKLDESILILCNRNNFSTSSISHVAIAGNTVMNHLFLKIDPYSISVPPYNPVVKIFQKLSMKDLNFKINNSAEISILPNIGGFVGGDITADLIVTDALNRKTNYLLIDIGTNCELVIYKNGEYFSASSPAGPALEGANIHNGMRAISGAIVDIMQVNNELKLLTVENKKPIGISGSGLFHIIEFLVKNDIINSQGKLIDEENLAKLNNKKAFQKRIKFNKNGVKYFILQKDNNGNNEIILTQKDIREFQLAKSSIVAGWKVLCEKVNINPAEIEQVYIAGAFGNFIRPETVLSLGLVPNISPEKINYIGDGALLGSQMILLDKNNIKKCEDILEKNSYIELSGRTDFQEFYIEDLGKI